MKQNGKKRLSALVGAAIALAAQAHAAGIADSDLGKGVTKLINDLGSFLQVLGPVCGGIAAVYFLIRRGMADEQEGKGWNRRIMIAIFCAVGVLLVGSIIRLIGSYFGVGSGVTI